MTGGPPPGSGMRRVPRVGGGSHRMGPRGPDLDAFVNSMVGFCRFVQL